MQDVFFYEAFEEEAAELRRFLKPGVSAGFTAKTIQEQGDAEPPARIISIRTQSEIPAAWAGTMSALLSRSTGYDHLKAYREKTGSRVPCGYLPKYCTRAVAEQAMLLWMALLRRLPVQTRQFARFHRDGLTGRECEKKTLLVVGVGNIGIEIVRVGAGLGMDVLGVDLVRRHADVTYVPIEEGLPRADVVVCAMNLTGENRGYFGRERWRQAKRGAVFVNIARGELAPAQDLERALHEGVLSGVGLDVYENETELSVSLRAGRLPADPPGQAVLNLKSRPDVILTPHNAFNTREAVERKSEQAVQQVCEFLGKGSFIWPIPE